MGKFNSETFTIEDVNKAMGMIIDMRDWLTFLPSKEGIVENNYLEALRGLKQAYDALDRARGQKYGV